MVKEEKLKRVWWIDQSSTLGTASWGEEITALVTPKRAQEFVDLEKATYEKPEEKEEVTASQVDKLRTSLVTARDKIEELEKVISNTPKGVQAAKKEVKKLAGELKVLRESSLKTDNSKDVEIIKLKAGLAEATKPGVK